MQIRRVLVDLIRRYVAYRVVIRVYRRFSLIDDNLASESIYDPVTYHRSILESRKCRIIDIDWKLT